MAPFTSMRAPLALLKALAALSPALLGCGGAARPPPPPSAWSAPPAGLPGASSGTRAERYFPLVDGHVYLYETAGDEGGEGVLIARVRRATARRGELRYSSGVKRFEYTNEGVVLADTGAFVLKEPLTVGTSWPGEHGGRTQIVAVGASIRVPAGAYQGCVQTLEERLGDRPVRYLSTFCPDVGVVSLEATSGAGYEKAELKSYAPPLDLGPDGVRRTDAPPEAAPPPPKSP